MGERFRVWLLLAGRGFGKTRTGAEMTRAIVNECGRIAHCAEVENKTGLGTVGGQINGGLTITMAPGFPFTLKKMVIPPQYKIACSSQGGILTSDILSDIVIRERIIKAGKESMQAIVKRFTVDSFVKIAIRFVKATGMIDMAALDLGGVRNVMDTINSDNIGVRIISCYGFDLDGIIRIM